MDDRKRLIEDRLEKLALQTDTAQMHGAREMLQELALFALSRTDFFKSAAFIGGTALRIFYGLQRFSEDLDFSLLAPGEYDLEKLTEPMLRELNAWGLDTEFSVRKGSSAVEIGWIKETSLGGLLALRSPLKKDQKIRVKVELDTAPPEGAKSEQKYGQFPIAHPVVCHDLPSLFSGKLHALLCRPFAKGRDWYDLLFYIAREVTPNLQFLHSALKQTGPFQGIDTELSIEWIVENLTARVCEFGTAQLKRDVEPFVRDTRELELWSEKYFEERIGDLAAMYS